MKIRLKFNKTKKANHMFYFSLKIPKSPAIATNFSNQFTPISHKITVLCAESARVKSLKAGVCVNALMPLISNTQIIVYVKGQWIRASEPVKKLFTDRVESLFLKLSFYPPQFTTLLQGQRSDVRERLLCIHTLVSFYRLN